MHSGTIIYYPDNPRVSSIQITESRHSNVPARAAGELRLLHFTVQSVPFLSTLAARQNTFGHFILPILTKVCYLLYCHKSPLRPMISRITALLLSVCGTERQLLCCSSLRCGCRSRERRDVIASAGPRPALISQELNLNLKWMLEIVQRAASRRVMVTAGNEPSRSLKS